MALATGSRSLLALALVAPLGLAGPGCVEPPKPKLVTSQYRSFPRTARVAKRCVIHTVGMSEFSQPSQGQVFAFDPADQLAQALVAGLPRTCERTVRDARAADPSRIDFDREVAVVGEVEKVRLRQGFQLSDDEVEIDATATITFAADEPPLPVRANGHAVQSSTFDNVPSAIATAFVKVVDQVNQVIFENRARIGARSSSD